jgi:hypothetical protein
MFLLRQAIGYSFCRTPFKRNSIDKVVAIVANNDLRQSARAFSTAMYFWKVPDKHNYQRSYDNENNQFFPAWNGHGILSGCIEGGVAGDPG